jgi:hypothetical protein
MKRGASVIMYLSLIKMEAAFVHGKWSRGDLWQVKAKTYQIAVIRNIMIRKS